MAKAKRPVTATTSAHAEERQARRNSSVCEPPRVIDSFKVDVGRSRVSDFAGSKAHEFLLSDGDLTGQSFFLGLRGLQLRRQLPRFEFRLLRGFPRSLQILLSRGQCFVMCAPGALSAKLRCLL